MNFRVLTTFGQSFRALAPASSVFVKLSFGLKCLAVNTVTLKIFYHCLGKVRKVLFSSQLCYCTNWRFTNCVLGWAHLRNGPICQKRNMGPAAEAQSRKDHHFDNSLHVSSPVNEPCALNRNRYSKDREQIGNYLSGPTLFWRTIDLVIQIL